MAHAVELTIGTGNKVSLNYQSQEVSLSITYQLEREDTDVQMVVAEKAQEVAAAHRQAWQVLRDAKVEANDKGKTNSAEKPSAQAEVQTQRESPKSDAATLSSTVPISRSGDAPLNEARTKEVTHRNGIHPVTSTRDSPPSGNEEHSRLIEAGRSAAQESEALSDQSMATEAQVQTLWALCDQMGLTPAEFQNQIREVINNAAWSGATPEILTKSQAGQAIMHLTRQRREQFEEEKESEKNSSHNPPDKGET